MKEVILSLIKILLGCVLPRQVIPLPVPKAQQNPFTTFLCLFRVCMVKSVNGCDLSCFCVHECEGSSRMGSRPRRYLFTGHENGTIQVTVFHINLRSLTRSVTFLYSNLGSHFGRILGCVIFVYLNAEKQTNMSACKTCSRRSSIEEIWLGNNFHMYTHECLACHRPTAGDRIGIWFSVSWRIIKGVPFCAVMLDYYDILRSRYTNK